MKKIILTILALAILGATAFGVTHYKSNEKVYQQETKVVEKNVEVKVDSTDKRIREAKEAAFDQTEAIARKAYDNAKAQAEREIELKVVAEVRAELQEREKDLQKESVAY